MRIYIIGSDGIALCREAPAAVNDGEIAGERMRMPFMRGRVSQRSAGSQNNPKSG